MFDGRSRHLVRLEAMHVIYYSHSYRQVDKDINEFFQELMLDEGLTPSLDPPSDPDRLNSAKPERHLRSTDGMIAVLTYRDPEPSGYILYEISLCLRSQKPVLVFIEDVLPSTIVSGSLFIRRFSRRRYLREVRNHRHALKLLKTYIGSEPPPSYQPTWEQRSCLIIGASAIPKDECDEIEKKLMSLSYNPKVPQSSATYLSCAYPYDFLISQSVLCLSFVENISPEECYLLGAARATLTPTILFSKNPKYAFNKNVPLEYQPRIVSANDVGKLCETLSNEINIFEEDYLELKEQGDVLRYRHALMQEGRSNGLYPPHTRDHIINNYNNLNVKELDMSQNTFRDITESVVNIGSKLDHVTQVVNHTSGLADGKKQEFAHLIEELREALKEAVNKRPGDAQRVAQSAEVVATEVANPQPNKSYLNLSVEGLKEAAKAVEDIAPRVIKVAAMIASFVATLA